MTGTRESASSRIAPWVVLVVLAAGAWSFVIVSGVLSRELDGGIFLSTTAGIRQGLPLYSGVWDNKDPLFDGAMALFASVLPVLVFVMDWFWLPGSARWLAPNLPAISWISVLSGATITMSAETSCWPMEVRHLPR